MKKSEALRLLAGTLSIRAVMKEHPELDKEALRALLLEAARAVGEESETEKRASGRFKSEAGLPANRLASKSKPAAGQAGFVFEPSGAGLPVEAGPPASLKVHTDGASRGNPGEAGIGVLIEDESGRIIREIRRYIGTATNNQAEYAALITALRAAREINAGSVTVFADSELLVKQVKGEYKVKHPQLQPLYAEAKELISGLRKFSITHVPREKNAHADALANEAIDKKITGK